MEEENDDVFLLQAAMTLKREMSQFLKQYTTSNSGNYINFFGYKISIVDFDYIRSVPQ